MPSVWRKTFGLQGLYKHILVFKYDILLGLLISTVLWHVSSLQIPTAPYNPHVSSLPGSEVTTPGEICRDTDCTR